MPLADGRSQGPLLHLTRAGPDTTWSKQLPLGFGTICEMQTQYGQSLGEVYFDLEEYPGLDVERAVSQLTSELSSSTINEPADSRRRPSGIRRLLSMSKSADVEGTEAAPDRIRETQHASKPSPLFGLFLDSSVCLVLRPSLQDDRDRSVAHPLTTTTFERVGNGNFLRTKSQIGEIDIKNFAPGPKTPFGPITAEMPRTEIIIY